MNTLIPANASIPASIYVSPTGNDSAAGTASAPVQSLSKAQTLSRAAGVGATVCVAGTYYLTTPLQFTSADSGINWVGSSAVAVISGGVVVTGWTASNTATGGLTVYRAAYNTATYPNQVRVIWVNGTRCTRANVSPQGFNASSGTWNTGMTGWTANGSSGWLVGSTATPTPATLLAYAQPSQLEVVLRKDWTESRLQVTSIANASGGSIAVNCATLANWATSPGAVGGWTTIPTFIENAFELLIANGTAGTFYQDYANGYLYLIPPNGVSLSSATAVAANLEQAIVGVNVSNHVLTGITVSHCNCLLPYNSATGYTSFQGGTYGGVPAGVIAGKMKAAVAYTNCNSVKLIRNQVTLSAGAGISVDGTGSGVEGAGNVTDYLSGYGIAIGDQSQVYQNQTSYAQNWHDNYVDDTGLEYRDCVGILAFQSEAHRITNNTVKNVPYSGISVGLTWGALGSFYPTANKDVVCSFNDVSNFMTTMNDGGGIYFNGVKANASEGSNYIHDASPTANGAYGLYFDQGSGSTAITGNVLANIGSTGVYVHFNILSANIVLIGTTCDLGSGLTSNNGQTYQATDYETVYTSTTAAKAAGVALGAGVTSTYADILGK